MVGLGAGKECWDGAGCLEGSTWRSRVGLIELRGGAGKSCTWE